MATNYATAIKIKTCKTIILHVVDVWVRNLVSGIEGRTQPEYLRIVCLREYLASQVGLIHMEL
jgi:hypothetical protein